MKLLLLPRDAAKPATRYRHTRGGMLPPVLLFPIQAVDWLWRLFNGLRTVGLYHLLWYYAPFALAYYLLGGWDLVAEQYFHPEKLIGIGIATVVGVVLHMHTSGSADSRKRRAAMAFRQSRSKRIRT